MSTATQDYMCHEIGTVQGAQRPFAASGPVGFVGVLIHRLGLGQREGRSAAGLRQAGCALIRAPPIAAIVLRIGPAVLTLIGLLGLLLLLLILDLVGVHDAVVVLGVLEIILGLNAVAGRIGVARQLQVLLIDMRGGAANLDFRTAGIEGPVGIVGVGGLLRPAAALARSC